eukprot:760912-Hanusia_phi.AAC.1
MRQNWWLPVNLSAGDGQHSSHPRDWLYNPSSLATQIILPSPTAAAEPHLLTQAPGSSSSSDPHPSLPPPQPPPQPPHSASSSASSLILLAFILLAFILLSLLTHPLAFILRGLTSASSGSLILLAFNSFFQPPHSPHHQAP